jgi:catechol 2,3-dioxygenase-like lactoylglutathione lyase family enzyme
MAQSRATARRVWLTTIERTRRAFNRRRLTTMRLNHLDLPVPDVAAAREFFETWLGFTHRRTLGRDGLAILSDESGLTLVLSRRSREGSQCFPETFHIGFHLDSPDAVIALYERLTVVGGYSIDPPSLQRGAFGFYLRAPGEILIEIAHRPTL